jgi:hypothetical protein
LCHTGHSDYQPAYQRYKNPTAYVSQVAGCLWNYE